MLSLFSEHMELINAKLDGMYLGWSFRKKFVFVLIVY